MNDASALDGVRVVDAAQVVAGPMLAMLLGDFGAEVIKVEQPKTGDPYRTFTQRKNDVPLGWKVLARNKKSITLDLRQGKGADLFRQLVSQSDVVIESFRPQTVERWDIGYETLSRTNPRLVMVMVSGFGNMGPYRDRPGFGTLIEAMSGFAHMTGPADGPPTLPPFALADSVAALYGAYGVMLALHARDRGPSGTGQLIDLSLLEPLFSILGPLATAFDQLGVIPQRRGNRIANSAPRNTYLTSDSRWIAISGSVQNMARNTFACIGRPELIDDPRFCTNEARVAHVEQLDEILAAWVDARSQTDALASLREYDVPAAPVMDIADLISDPHMMARGAITTVEDPELGPVRMQGVLPKLSASPGEIRHGGPRLGEHNSQVYCGLLGLRPEELAQLEREGVI